MIPASITLRKAIVQYANTRLEELKKDVTPERIIRTEEISRFLSWIAYVIDHTPQVKKEEEEMLNGTKNLNNNSIPGSDNTST